MLKVLDILYLQYRLPRRCCDGMGIAVSLQLLVIIDQCPNSGYTLLPFSSLKIECVCNSIGHVLCIYIYVNVLFVNKIVLQQYIYTYIIYKIKSTIFRNTEFQNAS